MKNSRTLSLVLSLAMCLLAISACKRENMPAGSVSGKIKTKVSSADQSTKSSYSANEELTQTYILDEEEGLVLQAFVSDNLSQPFGDAELNTKGTVVTTGNIATEYGKFGMEGFLDNFSEIDCPEEIRPKQYNPNTKKWELLNGDHYIDGGTSTYSNSNWTLTDRGDQEYPWLNNINFTFWSYAPKDHSGTYTYGKEKSRGIMTITGYETPASANNQEDLLVAFNTRSYPEDKKGDAVDILFRHALADICFNVEAIKKYNLTVKQIEISGVNGKGNCVITSSRLYESVDSGFAWTSNTPATFSMSESQSGQGISVVSDHFFFIPQQLTEKAKITITLSNNKQLTTNLNQNKETPTTWLAGKVYTYKLTYNGIEISIEDDVNGNIKDNVVIKSTENSTVKCYVRALIIGNWCQNLGTTSEPVPGTVMAPWSLSDGTFVGLPTTVGTASDDNWILGADGYYYYKYPVHPNTETGIAADGTGEADKLFESYTAPEDAPVNGTYLNLSIVVQAVKWNKEEGKETDLAKTAWGSTAAGYLSATDKGSSN